MLPSWPLGRGIRPTGISTSRACTGSSSGAAVTQSKKSARQDVFQSVAEEWIALQTNQLQPATLVRFRDRLTNGVYPYVGFLSPPYTRPVLVVCRGPLKVGPMLFAIQAAGGPPTFPY